MVFPLRRHRGVPSEGDQTLVPSRVKAINGVQLSSCREQDVACQVLHLARWLPRLANPL
jgi:hypothetical protein